MAHENSVTRQSVDGLWYNYSDTVYPRVLDGPYLHLDTAISAAKRRSNEIDPFHLHTPLSPLGSAQDKSMFEFGGFGAGSPEMGASASGNAYTGFNDYYNRLYPDQWSRAYGAQQAGGRTMFTDPPQNQTPTFPQMSIPKKKGSTPTTSFGQFENLGETVQGGSSNLHLPPISNSRVPDMDYATFLRFMSVIGPMLFGAQR